MDFFERQDRARRKTKLLIVYFVMAVGLTIVALYGAFALLFLGRRDEADLVARLWEPQLFLGVAGGTLFVILLGSLTKSFELRQGGGAVASMLGGRPLDTNTPQADERKLLNVVEEMAIASGTPMPEVYVLPAETSINAFAAGHSPEDAAIGVTDGCMRLLSRDELQGVIGHEFSHILNGDMRLNVQLMGIVNGLVFLTVIGRQILWVSMAGRHHRYHLGARSRGKGGNPLPLIGLALLVIGAIGALFARLIKSAVSRQREYLADAAAVQFTRNPGGLSGALKKIGGLAEGSRLQAARAEQASHLFFGNGLAESWFQLFSTHPPLPERIRAIDPAFDGTYPPVRFKPVTPTPAAPARETSRGRPPPLGGPIPRPALGDLLGGQAPEPAHLAGRIPTREMLPRTGAPTPRHLDYAAEFRAGLSPELNEAIHEPLAAMAMVAGLLLAPDDSIRAEQMRHIDAAPLPGLASASRRLQPHLEPLEARARLPLVLLSLPALRRLSAAQYSRLRELLARLMEADRQIDLFEYALQKIIRRHLEPQFAPRRPRVAQYHSLAPLKKDIAVLLSALARLGQPDPNAAAAAFRAGAAQLPLPAGDWSLLEVAQCGLPQIDPALDRLAQASPPLKGQVLAACAETVAADGEVRAAEAELLRAIGDTLDCPIPPFV